MFMAPESWHPTLWSVFQPGPSPQRVGCYLNYSHSHFLIPLNPKAPKPGKASKLQQPSGPRGICTNSADAPLPNTITSSRFLSPCPLPHPPLPVYVRHKRDSIAATQVDITGHQSLRQEKSVFSSYCTLNYCTPLPHILVPALVLLWEIWIPLAPKAAHQLSSCPF